MDVAPIKRNQMNYGLNHLLLSTSGWINGGHLLLALCTSDWKSHSQEGIYYYFVYIRVEVTGGHLLLTLCTSDWKSQEGIYYSLCAHQTGSHRRAFILLLTLCTSDWKSQEGIYYSLCVHQAGSHRRAFITHFVYIRLEVTGGHFRQAAYCCCLWQCCIPVVA